MAMESEVRCCVLDSHPSLLAVLDFSWAAAGKLRQGEGREPGSTRGRKA